MVGQTKVCAPFFGADFKCIDLQLLQQGAKKQVIRMHEEKKGNKEDVGPPHPLIHDASFCYFCFRFRFSKC